MSKGNVLVTGGSGYIGSHTVVELLKVRFLLKPRFKKKSPMFCAFPPKGIPLEYNITVYNNNVKKNRRTPCILIGYLQEDYSAIVVDNMSNSVENDEGFPESLKRVQKITGKSLTFYKLDIRNQFLIKGHRFVF